MAQNHQISIKHLKIDKANTATLVAIGVSVFVVIFSLVTAKSLLGQFAYQNRVISARKATVKQLKSNVSAVSQLIDSYKAFVSTPQNILGGNPSGTSQNDGNNAKIVLDALPSKYDWPGFLNNMNATLSNQGFSFDGPNGSDDQLAQQNQQSSTVPVPIQVPYSLTINGSYAAVQNGIDLLNRIIRPNVLTNVQLGGTDSQMSAQITMYTYYQPEKNFSFTTEAVK